MLGDRLARTLRVAAGDTVQVEFLDGRQRIRELTVGAVYDEPMGRSAFISEQELQTATGDAAQVNVVSVRVARSDLPSLITALKQLPAVTGVFDKQALIDHIRSNAERNLLVFTGVLSLFAAAIAAGVVYNSARIALAERRWELATLRVLGMNQTEVSRLMLGELALQTLLAVPIGCLAGRLLAALLVDMMSAETFTIPVTILPRTYAWAVGVMVVTSLVSAFAVHRRLVRLDLIAVLKTRE
jgi:putative ABC transport system permease protein